MAAADISTYHGALVDRLRAILADDLVGVYAGGSFALGDYEPGRSDLDVAAVVRRPLERATKDAIVAALRHEALPCPARGLELVVYSKAAVRTSAVAADFELNLNTGARMPFRADLEPGEETHWFAIDRSLLATRGVALTGPPASDVFQLVPRPQLLRVLAEGVSWWKRAPATGDAVLNACRSLHFAATGTWASKRAAGEWAAEAGWDPALVRDALAAREKGAVLDQARVQRFLETVEERLRAE